MRYLSLALVVVASPLAAQAAVPIPASLRPALDAARALGGTPTLLGLT